MTGLRKKKNNEVERNVRMKDWAPTKKVKKTVLLYWIAWRNSNRSHIRKRKDHFSLSWTNSNFDFFFFLLFAHFFLKIVLTLFLLYFFLLLSCFFVVHSPRTFDGTFYFLNWFRNNLKISQNWHLKNMTSSRPFVLPKSSDKFELWSLSKIIFCIFDV